METRGIGNCRRCGHLLSDHPAGGFCTAYAKRERYCECPQATTQERIAHLLSYSLPLICIVVLGYWWGRVLGMEF